MSFKNIFIEVQQIISLQVFFIVVVVVHATTLSLNTFSTNNFNFSRSTRYLTLSDSLKQDLNPFLYFLCQNET